MVEPQRDRALVGSRLRQRSQVRRPRDAHRRRQGEGLREGDDDVEVSPALRAMLALVLMLVGLALIGACVRPRRVDGPARGSAPGAPYSDPSRPVVERVADLVARMTRDEKISQLVTDAPAIPRLGVPAYHWWNEALHGVARAGKATVFPQVIGLAATFDEALVRQVADAISDEARAKYHEAERRGERGRYHGLTFFSPNVNIFRDPRWGRGQETWARTRGSRRASASPSCAACRATTLASSRPSRRRSTSRRTAAPRRCGTRSTPARARTISPTRTCRSSRRSCGRAAIASIMPAYNRLGGVPCAASPALLADTLRGRWGFDGYVVSDCGGIGDIVDGHHAAPTIERAAAMALDAGTDLSCGSEFAALARAIDSRPRDRRRDRSRRDALVRGALPPRHVRFHRASVPWTGLPPSIVESPAHLGLARAAARASMRVAREPVAARCRSRRAFAGSRSSAPSRTTSTCCSATTTASPHVR